MKIHVHQHSFELLKLVYIKNIIKKDTKDNLVIIGVEMKIHNLKIEENIILIQQQEIMQKF